MLIFGNQVRFIGLIVLVMIKPIFYGKLALMRIVTSHHSFTRAFSIRVFVTKNVVPTVIFSFDHNFEHHTIFAKIGTKIWQKI